MFSGAEEQTEFSLTGIFTYAGTGSDLYQSFITSLNWQPNKIINFQLSIPFVSNKGEDKLFFTKYSASGIGDVRFTVWADFTELFAALDNSGTDTNDDGEEEIPEEFLDDPLGEASGAQIEPAPMDNEKAKPDNRPHFRFALGVKFPTGDHDVLDSLDRLLPARFQPGWGVSCPILGTGYHQSFGELRVVSTLMYELSGGKNDEDYERGDILRFDSSAYFPVYKKYSIMGGLGYSLVWIPQEDRIARVKVADTNGTFHSLNLVGIMNVFRRTSAALIIKMPVGSTGSSSVNNVDFQYSLSITCNF